VLSFLEEAYWGLRSFDGARWALRLDAEQGNVRAVLRFLIDGGDVDRAARSQVLLVFYWLFRMRDSE